MAQQRLRPGPWKLVNSSGTTQEIQIDYEKFDVAGNATVEFEVGDIGLYDDTNLSPFRNPVQTFTQTTNVGVGASVSTISKTKKKVK
tara:strand:+ start:114 stop:374 length:261 start_codon:yes stop_codon:yes gene_type:complete